MVRTNEKKAPTKQKSMANKGNLEPKKKIEKKIVNTKEKKIAIGKEKPKYIANPRQLHVQNIIFEYQKERRRERYQEKKATLRIEEVKPMVEEIEAEIEETVEKEGQAPLVNRETEPSGNQAQIYRNDDHKTAAEKFDCSKITWGRYIDWDTFTGYDFAGQLSVSSVTHEDIWIMYLAMTGQKFNTAKYIIAKMKLIAKNAESKHPPAYGNIITALFEEKGLWNGRCKDSCKLVKVVPLDTTSLKRMHYAPNGPTWKKKNGEEARENDTDMRIKMLEDTVQTLTKRLEVVEGEVIDLKKQVKGKEAENNEHGEQAAAGTEHVAQDEHAEVAGKGLAMVVYTSPTAGNRIEEANVEDVAESLRSMAHSTAKTKTKATKPNEPAKKTNPTSSKKK
ncbi:hypothetical protein COLO4_20746 [Corchorus olitorius]|uniref:Uncharacterized protein n=1 Tax=Corchorus olitorius TaxID=93759 RepID=A0A1R3IXA7_9ROSI|nr:hypothetical protein COLO4_20746 [Corchorus olitorius]